MNNRPKLQNYDVPTVPPANNGPEKKFRAGAINASVWKNHGQRDGQAVEYHTISFERRYKDRDGQWKSTNSLRINDLPRAALLLQEAYRYCVMAEATEAPHETADIVM